MQNIELLEKTKLSHRILKVCGAPRSVEALVNAMKCFISDGRDTLGPRSVEALVSAMKCFSSDGRDTLAPRRVEALVTAMKLRAPRENKVVAPHSPGHAYADVC